MEIKTLTSTLVLSLLLTSPAAVAMELLEADKPQTSVVQQKIDPTEGEKLEGTTPHSSLIGNVEELFTVEDLTRSAMDLGLLKILVAGNQQNASPEEQLAAKQAGTQILEDAAKKNQEKKSVTPITTVIPTQTLLSTEEEKAAFSLWECIFGKKVDSEETKPTANSVISTPVEIINGEEKTTPVAMITEEDKTTPVLTSSIATPIIREESTSSWLTNLNPLNWWGTTNSVVTPTETVRKDFVTPEDLKETSNPQIENLISSNTGEDK